MLPKQLRVSLSSRKNSLREIRQEKICLNKNFQIVLRDQFWESVSRANRNVGNWENALSVNDGFGRLGHEDTAKTLLSPRKPFWDINIILGDQESRPRTKNRNRRSSCRKYAVLHRSVDTNWCPKVTLPWKRLTRKVTSDYSHSSMEHK